MKGPKLTDYKEVLHKVCFLAGSYYTYLYGESGQDRNTEGLLESIEKFQSRKRESELYKYLNELDFKTIKVIEVVMYIGRDYPFTVEEYKQAGIELEDFGEMVNSTYSCEDEIQPKKSPDMIFAEEIQSLDRGDGESKSFIINQILEKAPLYKFLRRGMRILEI